METRQQLLDSLTSHLALYHASKPTTTTAPRASVLRWFSGLSVTGRRAALTIVDRDLISVILHMLSQLHRFGHGFFFLLPDVPSNFDPSVPSVLFRRSSGLLARASAGNSAELELGESVLLFSSDESPNSKGLDAVTVSEDFVSDINKFVEVMDKISGGKFLTGDEDYKSPKWPELPWLVDKGYYSLEAYLANRLEIAIRVSWRESTGGGRKGNIGKSVKDNKFGIASNAFWRKKGCLDWWARLDHTKRDNLVRSFLAQTTRSIANEIVKKYEIDLNNKLYFFNHQSTSCWQTTKQSFFRKNRCSVSLDDISLLPYRRKKALPSVITRLVALYEISVLKRNFGQYGLDALFFTTLASAGTVRDFVLDKLRGVLMVVSVECTNLELLEDSGTSRPSPPVPSKGKKKASKSRRPKSKPSKENNLDGDDNKAINCVNKEPKASSDDLAVQERSENMRISKENKGNAEVSVENKGPFTKTKNKRKGKNKSATSSKSKTLESNKTKNPNSCTNTTPSLNTTATTTTTTTTTTSTNSSNNNNTDNISSVLTNSNDSPSKIENSKSKSCNNPSKSGNPIPETPNKKETLPPPNQTRYFELQNQNQNQTDTNPPPNFDPLFVPQIIPPPVLPLSYDWPPMYRNYNKLTQYVGPATYEFNQFLDDTETYWYSEEEAETKYSYSRRGYGQIFGGGVMYWSPSEYINGNNSNGPFSSRPPSMSSDDSAWGRHEADIVQIIDEITVPGGEVTLDEIPPHQQIDSLPYSMLRPIIIPSRPSRRGSTSSSSARRDNSRVKRPPSPVVLCVPRVPRPPPPSPVAEGSRRRGGSGFTVVRSGSSSPRNWAVRGLYCEENGNMEKGRGVLVGPEVVWTNLVHKGGCLDRGAANPVLQEHLIQISQWDQHPDIALPLQPPESVNSAARILMHNLLHEEIDYFCKQVGAGNLTRQPYINWAVNRVTKCLQVLWPRSRTNMFGSNVTGLALPTSDVDLVISLPPVRNLEPIKEAGILEGRNGIKETCLQHAARYLANQEWVRSDSLKTIENTAIPIIMLVAQVPYDINFCNETPIISDNLQEYPSNVLGTEQDGVESSAISKDCTVMKSIRLDISFKSSSHTGLQTSELVRELTEQFPACVPLALVLKKFLADRSLDHSYSGGLSSYCLVLLITRFLQHEHHVGQPMNQNLGRLLMDFLYFFGNVFDPRQMRTSIQGRGLYMNRERGLSIDPIHIDDPIYPVNNVGRNCFRIHQCIKAFADAFSMLENEVENFSGESSSATSASQLRLLRKIIPSIDSYE